MMSFRRHRVSGQARCSLTRELRSRAAPRARAFRRGTALTEFALVVPILITIMLFGMFFSELVRAKLKMLEAARFAAWEMTSHPLDDYGGSAANRNQRAFNSAMNDVVTETNNRFRDLDSVSTRPAGGLIAGYSGVSATLKNLDAPLDARVSPSLPPGSVMPLRALSGSSTQAHALFGFNQQGKVQVEMTMKLDNRILPKNFLNDSKGFFKADQWGGSNLQSIALKSRFTLVASGWALPDGSDAMMHNSSDGVGRVAGAHVSGRSMHGLWSQVDRMTHLAARPSGSELVGLRSIDLLSFILPKPYNSTYVVSHNYGTGGGNRGCNGDPGHPAPEGMNNLDDDATSVIDHPWRSCYDTAPFRDQPEYDDGFYVQQFEAHGKYFMGCNKAQADDSELGNLSRLPTDRNRRKIPCD